MPYVQKLTVSQRLTQKSVRSGDCLLHTGKPQKNGYVTISVGGKKQLVHRLAYIEANGPIPESELVRHRCDVRNCIEPTHLLIGTNAANTQDMLDRNRSRRHSRPTCKHGHARTPENRVVRSNGVWDCLPCRQRRSREQEQRRKTARKEKP